MVVSVESSVNNTAISHLILIVILDYKFMITIVPLLKVRAVKYMND